MSKPPKFLLPLAGLLVAFLIWYALTALNIWDAHLLPGPRATWDALKELWADDTLLPYIGVSLYRFALGYSLAVIFAVPLGLVLGWFTTAFKIVNPVFQLLRPISPMAWFPFIVLWFGIGDAPAIAIITIAAFFPVFFSTASAISQIDPILLRVADNFQLSRLKFFLQVAVPSAFPNIMVGLRMAIGTAWIFLVAGEMVGAQAGLGYLIVDARNNLRMDMVLAGILLIGAIGWLLDSLMNALESAVSSKWGRKNH